MSEDEMLIFRINEMQMQICESCEQIVFLVIA